MGLSRDEGTKVRRGKLPFKFTMISVLLWTGSFPMLHIKAFFMCFLVIELKNNQQLPHQDTGRIRANKCIEWLLPKGMHTPVISFGFSLWPLFCRQPYLWELRNVEMWLLRWNCNSRKGVCDLSLTVCVCKMNAFVCVCLHVKSRAELIPPTKYLSVCCDQVWLWSYHKLGSWCSHSPPNIVMSFDGERYNLTERKC